MLRVINKDTLIVHKAPLVRGDRSFITTHLLKKSLIENFIFCAVYASTWVFEWCVCMARKLYPHGSRHGFIMVNNFILILLHMYFYEKPNKSLSNKSFTIVAKFSILDVCRGPAYAFKLPIFSWLLALKFVTWFRNWTCSTITISIPFKIQAQCKFKDKT